MRTRILSVTLAALLLLPLMASAASAATVEDLNQPEVFLKQSSANGTCVLVSTAIMMRRASLLAGVEDWQSITLDTIRQEMPGMPYKGQCRGMEVSHAWLPGGSANTDYLIDMLAQHPEGIVILAHCVPHGVLLTDYTDGVFYCCDPAINVPTGRIPITEAYGTRIENSDACWYVSSSLPAPEPEEVPAPTVSAGDAVSRLVSALGVGDTAAVHLFGQALACHC